MTLYNDIEYLGSFHFEDDQYKISKLWLNVPCLRYIGKSNKPAQPKGLSDYSFMFANRKDLKILDLSDWDMTGDCININFHLDCMICGCTNLKEIIINRDKCSDNFIDYLFFYSISCNITITDISKKEEEINNMKKNEVVEEVKIPRLEDLEGILKTDKFSNSNRNMRSEPVPDNPRYNQFIEYSNFIKANKSELENILFDKGNIVKIKFCKNPDINIFELVSRMYILDSSSAEYSKVVKIIEYIDKDNIIVEDLSSKPICDTQFIISEDDIIYSKDNIKSIIRVFDSLDDLLSLLENISNKTVVINNYIKNKCIATKVVNIYINDSGKIILDCDEASSLGKFIYTKDIINIIKVSIEMNTVAGYKILIKFEDNYYQISQVEVSDGLLPVRIIADNNVVSC